MKDNFKDFSANLILFLFDRLDNKDSIACAIASNPEDALIFFDADKTNLGIKKKVIFKNWVVDTNIYLKKAKFFVLSSLYEGLPNALIDAVNCEVPSISTRCSGAEDILYHKNGIYFQFKNYEELAKKLKIMDCNYKESINRIIISKSKIYRFYIKNQVEKYIKYLNKIMINL